ncbi:unnamed protein product [Polarella glacialis]|uniref:Uncharacterized protein n=1 Tax=Polarella glacialis TaxID=89957 RepID=A0A813KS08_POLGL|nr:unnamed protein product [Polarella glacialis]
MEMPRQLSRPWALLAAACVVEVFAQSDSDLSPALRAELSPALRARHVAGEGRALQSYYQCTLRAARLLPTPSLTEYDKCFTGKFSENSSVDWGLPGAELQALADCWCANNVSIAVNDYVCCGHNSFSRMCSLDCNPDCSTELAKQCIQDCPPMCLEASEYVVEANLCDRCSADTCFPVLKCLTAYAENLTQSGQLERTCEESDFLESPELKGYWDCWRNMPKHSSHWNVLSSSVHCTCREGMIQLAKRTDCCKSASYGGGVCEATCPSEKTCSSQEAQTCIFKCQKLCQASNPSPSAECNDQCVGTNAPCRDYLGCRTPFSTGYVCDDGRWPDSSSGCCVDNTTEQVGCPKLCETQFVWRLDRRQGIPWWARWNDGSGVVYQCTCGDCPARTDKAIADVKQTVEESIWDNGQVMLVDIARREGMQLGPNSRMQELMVQRNVAVTDILKTYTNDNSAEAQSMIDSVNKKYAALIAEAANSYPDDGSGKRDDWGPDGEQEKTITTFIVVIVACTVAVLLAICTAVYCCFRRRPSKTPLGDFVGSNENVVIGSPVPIEEGGSQGKNDVYDGAPVTVLAPTKGKSALPELS